MTKQLRRIGTVALLALLLLGTVAPTIAAGAVGASAATISDRQAQLHVEQPHYVDGDVQASSANGTRVYHAKGESLEIHPQNFDAQRVVDYGIESGGGSAQLNYDATTGEFSLSASATGSYEVFWIVSERVAVEQTNASGNTSENATTTTTETRQVRYSAIIRVEGAVGMDHLASGDLEKTRADAQKWEEFNATTSDLRGRSMWVSLGLQEPMTSEGLIQSMIGAWLLVNDPIAALTGDSSILIVLFLSLTGVAFLGALAAYHTGVIAWLYRRLNIHETTEAAEGELSARLAALDDEERRRRLAKRDFCDVFGDDHIADAFRDLGANPLEALENWLSRVRQRFAVHDRLQAMDQDGYVAVVDESTVTDGGDEDGETVPTSARVVHEDALADDHEQDVRSLDVAVDDDLLEALDWADPTIREFDYINADFDRSRCTTPIEEFDLERLLELADLDMRNFSDEAAAGEYLRDLLEDIREHPICDDQGQVNTLRYGLEQFLRSACLLEDRYELPIDYYVDLVDRAVDEHDTRGEALDTLQDVQEGKYA